MGGNFIGATGLDENQEQFDILQENIDANASYINNLVGIPDPVHLSLFGINPLNPGLFGLVERAEVNIASLQSGEEALGTDLSTLTTQVETIETQITGIQGEISTIQGEITGIEGEISLIQFTELPAIVSSISAVGAVAGDALIKSNKSLGIWDEDGNNTYNMKSGNVAIGILPKGTLLNNKLEVNGSINIPTGSKYKINNVDLSYNDLTNKLTQGTNISIVGNVINNTLPITTNVNDIYTTNTGNVGIGTSILNNKLEVAGSVNIPTGSKYKINNIDLSYNDLTNKLTAGDRITIANNVITAEAPYASEQYSGRIPIREYGTGVLNYPANFAFTLDGVTIKKSTLQPDVPNNVIYVPQPDWNQNLIGGSGYIYNKPTLFDGNYNSLTNKLTAGTNISIINNAITNTLPITINANNIYTTNIGNVGIGTTILNNKLEVAGSVNIPTGSKYKINNVDLSYNDLTNKLTAGTNISIVGNAINNTLTAGTNISIVSGAINNTLTAGTNISIVSGAINNTLTAGTNISIVGNAINNTLPITTNVNDIYTTNTGNVGIGTSILSNKLEVAGNLNISAGSKYKINNVNLAFSDLGGTLSYNSLTDKLTAGTNISIVGNAINNTLTAGTNISIVSGAINNTLTAGTNISIVSGAINNTLTAGTNISIVSGAINNTYTYTLPTAGVGAGGNLGGVKVDGTSITITNGIISSTSTASGSSISLDGSTNNRSYGWTGSTSLLGRVGVAGNYSTNSVVEDVVLRSQGKLIFQSGTTNPAMVIDTTNNAFLRNAVGIGTDTISAGNMFDVGGTFKIAYSSGAERLTITSTGVQVNNTLNVSSGVNTGGLIRFGGFSDDSSFDLATIQNREYATNKSELLLFKGDNIEGLTGVDRIRLRAGAIAFDTFSADATTSATTENIRMFINGNGDVGIGTTQPTAELDIVGVNSGFGTTLDMLNMRYDASWGLKFVQNLTIAGNIIYNIVHRYNAVNNTLMTFSNANVGIGTTSPETTFDINGNLLVRAYEAGTGGTKGVFFRTGFISTNQYNCSILAYDHNAVSSANGLSINGFGGISFCTGANTRQEIMRISQGGNVGIGTTNPTALLDIVKSVSATGSVDLLNVRLDGNWGIKIAQNYTGVGNVQYDLINRYNTINYTTTFRGPNIFLTSTLNLPSDMNAIVSGGRARTYYINNGPSLYWGNGTGNQHVFRNSGNSDSVVITDASQLIVSNGVYQRSTYEAVLYTDSGSMSLCFGNIGDGTNASYLKFGAYASATFMESSNSRSIYFNTYTGTLANNLKQWQFSYLGFSYNGLNGSSWNILSDQRIKENIIKADLKTCYNNVKNINLYRYNFIDAFDSGFIDKNKLGYIAQEVKRYFPKATHRGKKRLNDNREIPDLLTIDVDQINLTLYGAVKQLIKVVEKQNKRIKALETLLNIEDNDDVEDDAGQPYERIYDENEIDIDTIEPTEPSNEV